MRLEKILAAARADGKVISDIPMEKDDPQQRGPLSRLGQETNLPDVPPSELATPAAALPPPPAALAAPAPVEEPPQDIYSTTPGSAPAPVAQAQTAAPVAPAAPRGAPYWAPPAAPTIAAGTTNQTGGSFQRPALEGAEAEEYEGQIKGADRGVSNANKGFTNEMAELLKSKTEYEKEQENSLMKRLNANRNAQFWDKMIGSLGKATAGLVGLKTGLNIGGNYKYEPQFDRAYEDTAATSDYTRRLGQWKNQQEMAISNALQAKQITGEEAKQRYDNLQSLISNTMGKQATTSQTGYSTTDAATQQHQYEQAVQQYGKATADFWLEQQKLNLSANKAVGTGKPPANNRVYSDNPSVMEQLKLKRDQLIKETPRLLDADVRKDPASTAAYIDSLGYTQAAAEALAADAFKKFPNGGGNEQANIAARRSYISHALYGDLDMMSTPEGADKVLGKWKTMKPFPSEFKGISAANGAQPGGVAPVQQGGIAPVQQGGAGPVVPLTGGKPDGNPEYAAMIEGAYPATGQLTPIESRARSFYQYIEKPEGIRFDLFKVDPVNKSSLWLNSVVMDEEKELGFRDRYMAAKKAGDEGAANAASRDLFDYEYGKHMGPLEDAIAANPKVGEYLESNGGLKRLALSDQAWHSGPGSVENPNENRKILAAISSELAKPNPDIPALDKYVAQQLASFEPASGNKNERERSDDRAAMFLAPPIAAPVQQATPSAAPEQQQVATPTPAQQQPAQPIQKANTYRAQPIGGEFATLSGNMPHAGDGFVATGVGTFVTPSNAILPAFEFKDKNGAVKHRILNPAITEVQDVPELNEMLSGYTRISVAKGRLLCAKPGSDEFSDSVIPIDLAPRVIKAFYSAYNKSGKKPFPLYQNINTAVEGK